MSDLYDDLGGHRGRGDLYLNRVLVEYDGRAERLERARFTHERQRGNGVSDLAVEIRRFCADDMFRRTPHQRLQTLLRALELAQERSRPRLRFGADTLRPPRLRPVPTRADLLRAAA